MEAYLADWFSVIVRWLHLITGIAWIGASLHFIWLDNSLEEPDEEKRSEGVKGELWSIHGGGIYNFSKYSLAPPRWPSVLHWSKWEAYTTWITGMLLMVAVYYLQSRSYLMGNDKWVSDPGLAVAASLGFLASGIVVYECLVRSPVRHRAGLFVLLLGAFVVLQCWVATRLFSDRAAFIHVGALLGSIMAGNVFLGIIPTQKRFVAAVQSGEEPDASAAAFAKQRSTHNNYFTLPVLFCMISNHYPFLYGHAWNWLILVAIIGLTAYIRHFFNLRHQGIIDHGILVRALIAFVMLAGWIGYERSQAMTSEASQAVADDEAWALISTHCTVCHSSQPTHPGFLAPPAGVLMDDPAAVEDSIDQILTAVNTGYMPLGNITRMTGDEKSRLIVWLESRRERAE